MPGFTNSINVKSPEITAGIKIFMI